jgi:hypothetical protein
LALHAAYSCRYGRNDSKSINRSQTLAGHSGDYTKRALTRPNQDKLAALAGVAKHVAALFQQDYVAGPFYNELPKGLLWSVPRFGFAHDLLGTYQGPPWSWASLNQPITLQVSRLPNKSVQSIYLSSVVDIVIDLVDVNNPFRQIGRALLTLKGTYCQSIGGSRSALEPSFSLGTQLWIQNLPYEGTNLKGLAAVVI